MTIQGDRRVRELACTIKAVVFDNDGVLTDNTEIIGFDDKTVLKRRSHYDGQGISFLRAIGIRVAIMTGESGVGARPIQQLVEKWNGLPSVNTGKWHRIFLATGVMGLEKLRSFNTWLENHGTTAQECAAMGDDFTDFPMLKMSGFKAAPVTAEKQIRDITDFVSERPAGAGAVRDLVNFILKARDIDPASLALS